MKPIKFSFATHGLGDVTHACHALRLYIDAGYDVQIQIEPNKAFVWNAAGIPIYDGPETLPLHPYYYLPSFDAFWDLNLPDHSSSKLAGFFDVDILPSLGTKEDVWRRLCAERINARHAVSPEALAEVAEFLQDLPKPIILLHSKGTNWQVEKSIPDATCFQFLCDMINAFDGSIIVLDWDRRAPMLGHERIKSICPYWPHMSLENFGAMCMLSDLLIGVDSGPFHLAGWFDIPTLYVSRKIPPVRCCLPSPNATYLVPAKDHEHWAARGPEWRFAEYHGDEATVKDIVLLAYDMLASRSSTTKVHPMSIIDSADVPGKYIYRRVGHDDRPMTLHDDGTIGEGAGGCERVWKIERTPVGAVLTIYGEHGGPTCHLARSSDGIYRGRWLAHERMPIELIPAVKQCPVATHEQNDFAAVTTRPETVTWSDLTPIGHSSDIQPDCQMGFDVGILTYNRFDLLHKAIEAVLKSTVLPRKIRVIDNSGGLWTGHPSRRVEIIRPAYNLGVARAFNALQYLSQPEPLIVIGDDIEVGPDLLEKLLACQADIVFADETKPYSCHLIRSKAWGQIGPWDAEFYPAYHEDNDYTMRAKLAGVEFGCPTSSGFIDHGPSATKAAMTPSELNDLESGFTSGRERYVAKWGGTPHLETYSRPWNGVPTC